MASDNHANYGRIGFTVFIGAFAIAIALIWLAGVGNQEREFLVETYYDHPVSGLSVGSAVNFRGVKIGDVREISFATAVYDDVFLSSNDFQRVIIVMALDCKRIDVGSISEAKEVVHKFIKAGIRATIMSNAVTGMSRIELNIPDNPLPVDTLSWKPRYIQILPQPSLMENLSLSVTKTLNTFNKTDFTSVWSNVSCMAESSAKLTKDVSNFIHTEKANMSAIVRNIEDASESIDSLAETLKNNPSLLLRNNDPEHLSETSH